MKDMNANLCPIDFSTLPRETYVRPEWMKADRVADAIGALSTKEQVLHLERSLAAMVRDEDREVISESGEGFRSRKAR